MTTFVNWPTVPTANTKLFLYVELALSFVLSLNLTKYYTNLKDNKRLLKTQTNNVIK